MKKKKKRTDRIVNRKYSLYGFRKINTNLLYNHNSYINMHKKKIKKKININIASIFITLTEINNETHYVPKKTQNKTKQNKKTKKNKTKLLR